MNIQTLKSNKNRLIAAAAIVATLAVGEVALAGGKGDCSSQHGKGHWGESAGKHSEKRLDRLAEKLELSDEQKTQLEAIMESNRTERQQHAELQREAMKAQLGEVLTSEQLEEFDSMMEKKKGRRGDKKAEQ